MNFSRLLVLACLVAFPAFVRAQKVTVDYDRGHDFSKYKTYTWKPGGYANNPYVNQQIIAALDGELQARGLKRVEGEADLNVIFHAGVKRDLAISRADSTGAPAWIGPGGGGVASQSWELKTGMLMVNLYEGATGTPVWRGTASEALGNENSHDLVKQAKKVEKTVRKSIEKMFRKFPVTQSPATK